MHVCSVPAREERTSKWSGCVLRKTSSKDKQNKHFHATVSLNKYQHVLQIQTENMVNMSKVLLCTDVSDVEKKMIKRKGKK